MTLLISQTLLFFYLFMGLVPYTAEVENKNAWHPLHLSSMELNYGQSGTLEISCRLFIDDMEDALSKAFKVPADLSASAKHAAMDALLKKYIALHLKLTANGKPLTVQYLGFEKDKEVVLVYVESAPVKALKKLAINNSLLYDLFDDQTNIMHLHFNNKRKSFKLDYPKTNAIILAESL